MAKELNAWYEEGEEPESCDGDTRDYLKLQKERLEDKGLQLKAAKEVLDKKLSVRETEKLVKRMQREAAGEKKEEKKQDEALTLIYQNLEDRMKSVMGTKVSIHNKDKNKGRIEIEYYSEAELERIVEMIESIG